MCYRGTLFCGEKERDKMKSGEFNRLFMNAVVLLREQIMVDPRMRCDVVAMGCVTEAGLPSTPRELLPVWVLLLATFPKESVDYDEIIAMSYRLTIPWWCRKLIQFQLWHQSLVDNPDPLPRLRPRD